MMSDDSGQVNPSSHSEPESKRGDSQRAGFAGKRLAALLKAVALLAFVTAGLLHLAGRISAQADQGADRMGGAQRGDAFDSQISGNAQRMMDEGKRIFRFDTFGDEVFWTDTLKLHRAVEGEKLGGVGPGVSPKTALSVGLKVDMDALPAAPRPGAAPSCPASAPGWTAGPTATSTRVRSSRSRPTSPSSPSSCKSTR